MGIEYTWILNNPNPALVTMMKKNVASSNNCKRTK